MTEETSLLPAAAVAVTWSFVFLASWEGSARRHRKADGGAQPDSRGADPNLLETDLRQRRGVAVHDALESRLAVWSFLLALVWMRATSERFVTDDAVRSMQRWLLLGGALPAWIAVIGGRLVGRVTSFPSLFRRPLTPLHGLSGWFLWAYGLISAKRRRGEPEGETDSGGASASISPHRGVDQLASLSLEEVMIPRSQVVALDGAKSVTESIAQVRRRPHSLYPVLGESIDQPLGAVRILDLADPAVRLRPVQELVRPLPILPETVKGLHLLGDLSRAPIPAALVVDEFGGMAGLVTVEDLVEVLVGDLEGEHEISGSRILSAGVDSWRIEGTCTIDEFNRRLGPLLPEGEYETVAGLFLDRAGVIPQAGDVVELPGVRLEVEQGTDRRIVWLRARLLAPPETAPAANGSGR